jgi:hypothetical protein
VAPRELAIWAITMFCGLLIYWKQHGRVLPKAPTGASSGSNTDSTIWNVSSVLLRMAVGAVVTALCVGGTLLWKRDHGRHCGNGHGNEYRSLAARAPVSLFHDPGSDGRCRHHIRRGYCLRCDRSHSDLDLPRDPTMAQERRLLEGTPTRAKTVAKWECRVPDAALREVAMPRVRFRIQTIMIAVLAVAIISPRRDLLRDRQDWLPSNPDSKRKTGPEVLLERTS